MRVGTGYDIHRLGPDRLLILGGVEIPFDRGLIGHSDGDAVLHAITDAALGAAGLPDIGEFFPDDDPAHLNADSAKLLASAMQKVAAKGFAVGNLDVNIIAERPKLKPYKEAIASRVAEILGVSREQVSIKAKTREKLGAVGRNEAIEVHCVILLQEIQS